MEALHRLHEDDPRAADARWSVPEHARARARGDRVFGPAWKEDRVPSRRPPPEPAEADRHADRLHVREPPAVGALERDGGARGGGELPPDHRSVAARGLVEDPVRESAFAR